MMSIRSLSLGAILRTVKAKRPAPAPGAELGRRGYAGGRWRAKHGLPPRYSSGPLAESPEWSFTDGRGPAPLGLGQRKRYFRDKEFTEQIIKYMKQHEEAKRLVPEQATPIAPH